MNENQLKNELLQLTQEFLRTENRYESYEIYTKIKKLLNEYDYKYISPYCKFIA